MAFAPTLEPRAIEVCGQCGKTHERNGRPTCIGHRTGGEPCLAWAIIGGVVCNGRHGGSAPQVRAAANRRIQEAEAQRDCLRLGVPVEDGDPGQGLLEAVRQSWGAVIFWQTLVEQLDPGMTRSEEDPDTGEKVLVEGVAARTFHVSGRPTGEAKPHVYIVQWERERDRWRECCVAALKAGVEERRLRMEELEVRQLFTALAQSLGDADLTPEQAQAVQRSFAKRLRDIGQEAIEVETGESAIQPTV
jgi:hypothetical protein